MAQEKVESYAIMIVKNKIENKEYETSGSATATASASKREDATEIADSIAKFIALSQAHAIADIQLTKFGQSKDGFYPLYLSEELAIKNSNTNPPATHSHVIENTKYFMPNKLNNTGLYHGDSSNNLTPFVVPNSPSLLSQMLTESSELSTLKSVLEQLNLLEFFQNTFEPLTNPTTMNNYTLLAPLNSAFEDEKTVEILSKLNNEELKNILLSHVVSGSVFSSDLKNGQTVSTLGTLELEVSIESNNVYFIAPGSKSKVIYANIPGTNGVVHVLDKVLLPSNDNNSDDDY